MASPQRADVRLGFAGVAPAAAIVTGCAILAGLTARILLYFQNVSLWFDEILLALNIATRSYTDLGTLKFEQAAPPLYMWIEHLCVALFGLHEASLRLPSLVAGVATLILVAALAFRIGGPYLAASATAIAALSANLCRYANELKPYGMDAAVAAALLVLAMPLMLSAGSGRRRVLLAVAGAFSVFLSMPAVFVLAGIATALFFHEGQRGLLRRQLLWMGGVSLLWAAASLFAYERFYAAVAQSEYMRHYWAAAFITPSSGLVHTIAAIGNGLISPVLGLDDVSVPLGVAGSAFLALGIWGVFRRLGTPGVGLLCGPLAFAIAAALLGKWILTPRLMMFAAPAVSVLIGAGVWQVSQWMPRALQLRAFWVLGAVLILYPMKYTVWRLRHGEQESNRALVSECVRQLEYGDIVYVYPRATAAWVFYSQTWQARDRSELQAMIAGIEAIGPNAGNVPSRHQAVIHEGFDRKFTRSGRVELFGVPTGVQATTLGHAGNPDSGWADNEIDRILSEHPAKRVWLVFATHLPAALDSMLQHLNQRGLWPERVYQGNGAVLYRLASIKVASR